jgi:hypothetical protein
MKAVIVINYASEEDIGKKTSIHLLNEENEWVEDVVIQPLPERWEGELENTHPLSVYSQGMRDGFNMCLEEITE